jgi:hypothetical protein
MKSNLVQLLLLLYKLYLTKLSKVEREWSERNKFY